MKTINKTTIAIGTTIAAGLSSTIALADNTPFEITELSSGYMNLAEADMATDGADSGKMKMKDGACGEGSCGSKMTEEADKAKEGSCGDKKKAESKAMEAKCGEGKCGDSKKAD